jgi:hypothetical protein
MDSSFTLFSLVVQLPGHLRESGRIPALRKHKLGVFWVPPRRADPAVEKVSTELRERAVRMVAEISDTLKRNLS